MTYTEPNKVLGLAGRDNDNGDPIIKMVNASDEDCTTDIKLDGDMQLSTKGDAYTLSSTSLDVENTFTKPKKYVPIQSKISGIKNQSLQYAFSKYPITVL